jgi:fructokinase
MADGRLHNANSTCLNGQPLAQDLETAIGQPVRYANDANCLALSEAVDGAGAGHPVVWAVILGTGTGAGLAIDGRVMTGPNRLCGEWGHNPLPWMDDAERAVAQAEPCWCGQPGCTETFVSGPGMARDHLRHGGEPLAAIDIAARAAAGDAACRSTLDRHADRLARALASVVNLLDPDVVVLAGGLSLIPGLVPQVLERWERWIFRGAYAGPLLTRLVTARHGDASGVRGAAWLWREPARRSAG